MPIPMLDRRTFTATLGAALAAPPVLALSTAERSPNSTQADHTVMMLNADCNDANKVNVFEPAVLYVEPGESIQFIAADPGHNTASKRGMIPEGADPWNGAVDEETRLTLTVPGVYGYLCLPHYEWGMVGVIVVGNDLSNLAKVKKLRHPGQARKAFRALLKEVESAAS